MLKTFLTCFLMLSNSAHTSAEEYPTSSWKLTRLVLEQLCLHKETNIDYYRGLLSHWHADLDKTKKPVVYILWQDNPKQPWQGEFLQMLRHDLVTLGINVIKQQENPGKLLAVGTNKEDILKAHKIIIIGAEQNYTGAINPLKYDGEFLLSLVAELADKLSSRNQICLLQKASILPLRLNGSEYFTPIGLKAYTEYCLPVENAETHHYLDLIKRLITFAYDIPQDKEPFDRDAEKQFLKLSSIGSVLNGLDEKNVRNFLGSLK